jgi:hypothetical protein
VTLLWSIRLWHSGTGRYVRSFRETYRLHLVKNKSVCSYATTVLTIRIHDVITQKSTTCSTVASVHIQALSCLFSNELPFLRHLNFVTGLETKSNNLSSCHFLSYINYSFLEEFLIARSSVMWLFAWCWLLSHSVGIKFLVLNYMTLSVCRLHGMEWLMSDEVEGIWKEAILDWSIYYSSISLEQQRKACPKKPKPGQMFRLRFELRTFCLRINFVTTGRICSILHGLVLPPIWINLN